MIKVLDRLIFNKLAHTGLPINRKFPAPTTHNTTTYNTITNNTVIYNILPLPQNFRRMHSRVLFERICETDVACEEVC